MANSPQIEFLPEPGMDVRQLFILLHGVGGTPDSLLPLAEAVRAAFPTAAVLIPEGFEPSMAAAPAASGSRCAA